MGFKRWTLSATVAVWLALRAQYYYNFAVLPPLPHGYYAGEETNGTCSVVRGVAVSENATMPMKFCEDAVTWKGKTLTRLVISCDPNRQNWNTVMGPLRDPTPRGVLWIYDFGNKYHPAPHPLPLEGFPHDASFHPLGIDVLGATPEEPAHLFVVNHGKAFSTVEQFKLVDDPRTPKAIYVRTWAHPSSLNAPNSIVPLSPTAFYVTNDHYFTRRLPSPWGKFVPLIETLFAVPLGWVDLVEWNEDAGLAVALEDASDRKSPQIRTRRIVSGIPFANGISMSHDGREVAIVSTTQSAAQFYDRDPSSNELKYRDAVLVPFNADNIAYDESEGRHGDIGRTVIVAGHPHFATLVKMAAGKTSVSPSWVLEIAPKSSEIANDVHVDEDGKAPYPVYRRVGKAKNYSIRTLYQSSGEHFPSSTHGVRYGDNFFVTGLYGDGILHCSG
ncbi:hypothetical protein DL93DRAFT_574248 [Clavulina sp. PMI_390]|nr:hypothetical protein DL93DRAFT_574248 [Clavulina sp. PMI_390]